jgi:hypothetical protein
MAYSGEAIVMKSPILSFSKKLIIPASILIIVIIASFILLVIKIDKEVISGSPKIHNPSITNKIEYKFIIKILTKRYESTKNDKYLYYATIYSTTYSERYLDRKEAEKTCKILSKNNVSTFQDWDKDINLSQLLCICGDYSAAYKTINKVRDYFDNDPHSKNIPLPIYKHAYRLINTMSYQYSIRRCDMGEVTFPDHSP